jgi:GAF domain-containing protein
MSDLPERGRIDHVALERSLAQLRERAGGAALEDALQQMLEAARLLFDATGTGLMFIDDGATLRYVASTDEAGELLERTQEESGEGPCVDALTFDEVVQSQDLARDDRWPSLLPDVPDAGVRAVLGVPVHLAGTAVASLDAYVDEPWVWEPEQVTALEAYATLIENLLESALQLRERGALAEQLQRALDNRVMIERAVGFVMGQRGVDAVTAFNLLRRRARDEGRKVVAVAEDVLQGAPTEGW